MQSCQALRGIATLSHAQGATPKAFRPSCFFACFQLSYPSAAPAAGGSRLDRLGQPMRGSYLPNLPHFYLLGATPDYRQSVIPRLDQSYYDNLAVASFNCFATLTRIIGFRG